MAPTWLIAMLASCPEASWRDTPELAASLVAAVGSFKLVKFT